MQECLLLQVVPGVLGFLAALGVALQRVRAAEGSEDSLSLRSSTAEVSEASLRPRSSVAERAESVLLALSTASRRRAPFFMVRLVPMHIRFVSFSVDVLFPSAARFRRFGKRGRAVPSAVAFGAALSVGAVRAGVRRARGISDGSENRILC